MNDSGHEKAALPEPPPAVRRARYFFRTTTVWSMAGVPLAVVLAALAGAWFGGPASVWLLAGWVGLVVLAVTGWMGILLFWYMRFTLGALLAAVCFVGGCVAAALVAPDPLNHLAIVALALGVGGALVKIGRHDPELRRATLSEQWKRASLGMGDAPRNKQAGDEHG